MGGKKKTTTKRSEGPVTASLSQSRIEQYYNKIVGGFVVLTAILLVVIVYFSFSKTTLTVKSASIPKTIAVEATLADLEGMVLLTDVEGSSEYTDVRSTTVKTGKAGGTVTLYNNYSQNQPLVATTRLLSDDGVLFRTTETVTVPAGGTVDVPVIADVEGVAGDIAPSSFEIVALWDGLKKDIYGKSSAAMTGGELQIGAVTERDIEEAHAQLTDELLAQGEMAFEKELSSRAGLPENAFIPADSTTIAATVVQEASAQEGDDVSAFSVTQHLTVAAPVVNKEKLFTFVQEHLAKSLGEQVVLQGELTVDQFTMTVDALTVDELSDTQTAELTISGSVHTVITTDHPVVSTEKLTNKTASEVRSYLAAFPEIAAVEVSFSPFWVKRTPALADHIIVHIQN